MIRLPRFGGTKVPGILIAQTAEMFRVPVRECADPPWQACQPSRRRARGRSILPFGPRQTGKTTLLGHLGTGFAVSLASPAVRQRDERDPSILAGEAHAIADARA
jgi:hypothetical protein